MRIVVGVLLICLALATVSASAAQGMLHPYAVEGDAIALPLNGQAGDAERGRTLMADRQRSLCILCHRAGPVAETHLHGTLAPDLSSVGARLSEGQIRLRIVDMKRLNPDTIMPSYYRVKDDDVRRVAAAWCGRPILASAEIEDIVAFLVTLKD